LAFSSHAFTQEKIVPGLLLFPHILEELWAEYALWVLASEAAIRKRFVGEQSTTTASTREASSSHT
jgi:hypothetical protein